MREYGPVAIGRSEEPHVMSFSVIPHVSRLPAADSLDAFMWEQWEQWERP